MSEIKWKVGDRVQLPNGTTGPIVNELPDGRFEVSVIERHRGQLLTVERVARPEQLSPVIERWN